MSKSKNIALGVLIGSIGTVGIAALGGIAYVYSGGYNVAATEPHAPTVRWALDTSYQNSVQTRSDAIEAPADFAPEMVEAGGSRYAEMCAHCHGAPGAEPAGWSRGMRPEPPHLVEAATEWTTEEIYWIAENGIKMSGMPAFGSHHAPEEIAAIAAFVSELPGLSPEDYAALTDSGGHGQQENAATVE